MRDRMLTTDVPLGPFEGTEITVHSAKGKNAKLHVRRECGQLRTSNVVTAEVPLNAAVVDRFCSGCADWGPSVRPTTGLGIFMGALGGTGLLHQLQAYAGPDEDVYWTQEEVRAAAELLRAKPDPEEDDDDSRWEARREAEELQDRVLSRWRHAAESLYRSQAVIAHFRWLTDWARPKVVVKENYLATLREQAALFVDPAGLVVAAAAAALEVPQLPADDPAFAVLGDCKKISAGLSALWRRWQYDAERGWEGPDSREIVRYHLVRDIRPNKKGHDEALAGAARLIRSWEEKARAVAESTVMEPTLFITARLPEREEEPARPGEGVADILKGMDPWTTGVLVTWAVHADWSRGILTLKVPALVADRLLAMSGGITCVPGGTEDAPIEVDVREQADTLRPGIFDDSEVFTRQPVTLAHLRALRVYSYAVDQLCIVFSTSGGAEVLSLDAIERRLAQGWTGVIVASASDLPSSVISPWVKQVALAPDTSDPSDARQPGFGAAFSLTAGAQDAVRWPHGDRAKEHNLRLLAMARGVSDLRTLDTGRSATLPPAVWEGLLAPARLDLAPFRPPNSDRWRSGSGLPLGVLRHAQIYTTNADPRLEGKGHSPLCRHTRERGVAASDDLLSVADLLARDDFDWCSKCGGYAVRRLTDTQLSYYRAAHSLHDITRQLDDSRPHRAPVDIEAVVNQLEELADWEPGSREGWGVEGHWPWREAVREQRRRAEKLRCADSS
ncbi:hypothetical protein [Streptomyces sp. NPDC046887]|uniref:hypothetical protein n=1 Tax=Streptomyces sp. NPDC046887 TaxID=3155472 RepID=UPI0033DDAFEF